jgi:hypothetical protein
MTNLDSFINEIFALEVFIKKKSEEIFEKLNFLTEKRTQLESIKQQRVDVTNKSFKLKEKINALETQFSILDKREDFIKSKLVITTSFEEELKTKLVTFTNYIYCS